MPDYPGDSRRPRIPGERFRRRFTNQASMLAALKRPVIQDELIETELLSRYRFSLIQIRFKSTVKVLDHRTAPVCRG
jgi:hypothetical protein